MKAIALLAVLAIFSVSTVSAQECEVCEYVVGFIESYVENNASVADIDAYLQKLCSTVPGFSAVCDAIATEGLDAVVSWLKNDESPQQVCTQLGTCTSKIIAQPTAPSACNAICLMVVSTIEGWIDSQSSEAEIESALDTICSLVPSFSVTCDAIIQAGVPEVINWIETSENATVVCGQLGQCSSSKNGKPIDVRPDADIMTVVPAPKIGDDCNACQTLISTIEGWVDSNSTEGWIDVQLDSIICKLVPSYEATCDAIVQYGLNTVIGWINQYENPEAVCTQLGLCTSKQQPSKTLHNKNSKISAKLVKY